MTAQLPARVPPRDPLAPKGLYKKLIERFAQLRFVTWFLVNVATHFDPWLMKVSRGRLNSSGTDLVVVLHHVGARSGALRKTPLAYFTQGDDVILIASKGGAPEHPAWLHNIRKNPDVELWVGPRGGAYRAREATGEERARLWSLATSMYSGFDGYQARTGGREIPVVVCSPR